MKTNEEILALMNEDMMLRNFSEVTKRDYIGRSFAFLQSTNKNAEDINERDIREYLIHLIKEKGLKEATVNTYNASLRFLFDVTLNRSLNCKQIPRMKQSRSLPEILTHDELQRIFENASSLRDKTMFMTMYGSGLRISELCNLKVSNIDSKSMRLFVDCSKGGRDRYTILSQANLEQLREYYKAYRPNHPDNWLFISRQKNQVSISAVQRAFRSAVNRSNINKSVTVHTLRASFATHMLESGADIYLIKQLLGHTHIQSTTFYLCVTNFDPSIKSPLDLMPGKEVTEND